MHMKPIKSYEDIPFPCWIHVIGGDWHHVKKTDISKRSITSSCDYYSTNERNHKPSDAVGERLLSAHDWCGLFGIQIIDPDGWRSGGPTLDTRITLKDFNARIGISTISSIISHGSPNEKDFS